MTASQAADRADTHGAGTGGADTGGADTGRADTGRADTGGADSAEIELATRMRLAIGRLHRRLSRRAVGGLTPSQLSVLATVQQHGPLRLGELANREVITPPTVTRLVASLHERALVVRVTDPEDGRAALIEVSREGGALLDQIRCERTAFIAQRIARLDPGARAEVAGAVSLLEHLIDLPEES